MLCVEWRGPIVLSADSLRSLIPPASPAVAVLGTIDTHGEFTVKRLVRSDTDIRTELMRYLDVYPYCKILICESPAQAYVTECEIYHRSRTRECERHPGEPGGLNVVCPYCGFRTNPRIVA